MCLNLSADILYYGVQVQLYHRVPESHVLVRGHFCMYESSLHLDLKKGIILFHKEGLCLYCFWIQKLEVRFVF